MGPLANPRRVNAMESLLLDAQEKGAKVETGGKRIGNEGNFFEPTVLTNVPENARIMNEEPFCPLAVMLRFKGTDDALERANSLPFGLASYAFTKTPRPRPRFQVCSTMEWYRSTISGSLCPKHHSEV